MAKSEAIGEVECPHKGCSETKCKVYAFVPRTEGRRSVFTGKKYLICPVHGRQGSDGSQAITDYILENGKIWGANKPAVEPAAVPAAKPEKTAANAGPAAPAKVPTSPKKSAQPSPKIPEPKPESPKPSIWKTLI